MSGHSKWSSIKHKKALVDAKRGKIFTKMIREITIASRLGGMDLDANPRLRTAVQNAKSQNMPNDTIQRAVRKGGGEDTGVVYQEITYEGYGPAGSAVIIEALTDNRNRTVAAVRAVFSRHNGSLGATNAVRHLFQRKGAVYVQDSELDEEKATELALEVGAEDLKAEEGGCVFFSEVEGLYSLREELEKQGQAIDTARLEYLPQLKVSPKDEAENQKIINFLEALEEEDDVQNVFCNVEFLEEATVA